MAPGKTSTLQPFRIFLSSPSDVAEERRLGHRRLDDAVPLLGFPPAMFLTCYIISTVAMYWYHTRLVGRMGPLEWVLMTPSHHRVHHGCDAEYLNKNNGSLFIVWDLLFGTCQRGGREPTYGVVKHSCRDVRAT